MLYGQTNLWRKSPKRTYKAYALGEDNGGAPVVLVWDEGGVSRTVRDMDLDTRGEARDDFRKAYGVVSVYKCSAAEARKAMSGGARVIVTSTAVTLGVRRYEGVSA